MRKLWKPRSALLRPFFSAGGCRQKLLCSSTVAHDSLTVVPIVGCVVTDVNTATSDRVADIVQQGFIWLTALDVLFLGVRVHSSKKEAEAPSLRIIKLDCNCAFGPGECHLVLSESQ